MPFDAEGPATFTAPDHANRDITSFHATEERFERAFDASDRPVSGARRATPGDRLRHLAVFRAGDCLGDQAIALTTTVRCCSAQRVSGASGRFCHDSRRYAPS
jgi:hypothetical protein